MVLLTRSRTLAALVLAGALLVTGCGRRGDDSPNAYRLVESMRAVDPAEFVDLCHGYRAFAHYPVKEARMLAQLAQEVDDRLTVAALDWSLDAVCTQAGVGTTGHAHP